MEGSSLVSASENSVGPGAVRGIPATNIRTLYERLIAAGKPKMSATAAAMRKLVQIAFGVFKHQRPYQPQSA